LKKLREASLEEILNAPEMGSGILKEVEKLKERFAVTEGLSVEQIFGSAPIAAGVQRKIEETAAVKEGGKTPRELMGSIREHGVAAKSLYDFLHSKTGQKTLDELVALGLKTTEAAVVVRKGPLSGMSIVVTGTLEHFSRSQIKNEIELQGGKSVDSVSKSTTFVLVGAEPGSKLEKAKKLGVEVIEEGEFMKRIGKVT
jgi:NAD-dependent DNA ligase